MKTRILCVCFAILLSLSFPACSGETVQSAAAAGTAEQPDIRAEAPADGSTGYTGTVTKIDANTITLDTGTETVSLPLTASTVFYRSMGMGGQRPDKTEERAVRTEQGAEGKPSSEQPNGTAPAAPAESTAPSEPRSEERTQADKRERERPETSDEQAAPAAGAAAKDTEKKIPDRNDS